MFDALVDELRTHSTEWRNLRTRENPDLPDGFELVAAGRAPPSVVRA
jgi:hypothetical protein